MFALPSYWKSAHQGFVVVKIRLCHQIRILMQPGESAEGKGRERERQGSRLIRECYDHG